MTTSGRGRSGDDFDISAILGDFRGRRRRGGGGRLRLIVAGVIVAVLALVLLFGVELFTEWLWFDSLGYLRVYQTTLVAQIALFLAGAIGFFGFVALNVLLAQRLSPRLPLVAVPRQEMIDPGPWITLGALGLAAFLALVIGGVASDNWNTVLMGLNAVPFGRTEPIFGRDIGFYLFELPLQRFLQGSLITTVFLSALAAAAIYVLNVLARGGRPSDLARAGRAHLLVLGAIFMGLLAWGYQIDIAQLVYSGRGAFFGAGYTDLNAQLFAQQVLTLIAVVTAILMLASALLRSTTLPIFAVATLVIVAIVAGNLYPAFVQRFQVAPNELEREMPYLEAHIEMTRLGFGLEAVQEVAFPADDTLDIGAVRANPSTIRNIRLWDPRPLRETYNQIQSIRAYYGFHDVDVDRYTIDGDYRQVMVAAREMYIQQLAQQAQTWTNRTLQFTHGLGVAMTPVNEVSREGLPILFIRDVPPVGVLNITRPEIYFGERTDWPVVVKTRVQEFNYPLGDSNVFTTYQEDAGVVLDSVLKRFAYAWHLGDANLILSEQLTPESSLLYRRVITDRVPHIAPFLRFDRDPYLVVTPEGRLVWIMDGFTTSRNFPNATRHPQGMNYIRNSVKVTVDAYNGGVRFFIIDPADPVVQTWARIFPGMFEPISAMSPALIAHLRYPEDLFTIQAQMYQTYHMTDPRVFYNREDVYRIPREIFDAKEQEVVPYFVIIRLAGQPKEEFLLMLPFTPGGQRNNTIAWLAARMDEQEYGKLLAYVFPKDKLVFGPLQIESRISQDPRISSQFSLWSQGGTRIIRGNLLMIPIENSFLYVEPIFLQAQNSSIPELKRVVTATGNRIAMEPTLPESIDVLFGLRSPSPLEGVGAGPTPQLTPTPAPIATPAATPTARPAATPPAAGDAAALARAAVERYNQAQEALRRGDFAAYGDEIRQLEGILNALVIATGNRP